MDRFFATRDELKRAEADLREAAIEAAVEAKVKVFRVEAEKKVTAAIRRYGLSEVVQTLQEDASTFFSAEAVFVKDEPPPVRKTKGTKKTPKTINRRPSYTSDSERNSLKGSREVLSGRRPPLRVAMIKVMGDGFHTAIEITKKLAEKKWLPNSNNPRQYVSFVLSTNTPSTFERLSRGQYCVRPEFREKFVGQKMIDRVRQYIDQYVVSDFESAVLAAQLGVHPSSMSTPLTQLHREGFIAADRSGPGPAIVWRKVADLAKKAPNPEASSS